MLVCSAGLAQDGAPANKDVTFPSATAPLPAPYLSCSGRFNSLNPPVLNICRNSSVTGRVVTPRLIRMGRFGCMVPGGAASTSRLSSGTNGQSLDNCLMDLEFSDPADAARMVAGNRVTIEGNFIDAFEYHGSYPVNFLIAKNAKIVGGDLSTGPATSVPDTPSFMLCQPPQLDALAGRLGRELCVQSSLVANLKETGVALEAAASAPMPGPPSQAASGDPAAITYRIDPEHSDAHLTALACARNNYWAWWVGKQADPVGYGRPAPP